MAWRLLGPALLAAFLPIFLAIPLSAPAAACPGLGFARDEISLGARQLAEPRVASVRAGGTVLLGQCPGLPGVGNIPFDPTASILYLPDRRGVDLELTATGPCDPVLLVRGPGGAFHFDDDDGGGDSARLRLLRPAGGRYSIWVGSRAGHACAARLHLRTLPGVARAAAVNPRS